ncbi:Endonuclease/exonuclease/phosphatase [Hyaloraphidium curvatum]|nr:Endonuclease/exonuclease/phosphatase [Hyaloraphidium curvatum]
MADAEPATPTTLLPGLALPADVAPAAPPRFLLRAQIVAAVLQNKPEKAVVSIAAGGASAVSEAAKGVALVDAAAALRAGLEKAQLGSLAAETVLAPSGTAADAGAVYPFFQALEIAVLDSSSTMKLTVSDGSVPIAAAELPLSLLNPTPGVQHIHMPPDGHLTLALSLVPIDDAFREFDAVFGTWNVGNARPSHDAFEKWLGSLAEELVVVGVQESSWDKEKHEDPPSSAGGAPTSDAFYGLLAAHMTAKGYRLLRQKGLGEMRIAAFVKAGATGWECDGAESEATGLVGVWPNKGTILLHLRHYGFPLSFLSSHLAAHEGHVSARRSDYRESVRGIVSKLNRDFLHESGAVFWAGDFNYRLEFGEEKKEFKEPPKDKKKGLFGRIGSLGRKSSSSSTASLNLSSPTSSSSSLSSDASAASNAVRPSGLVRSETFPVVPEKREDTPEDDDPEADRTLWEHIASTVDHILAANPPPGPDSPPTKAESPYKSLLDRDELAADRRSGLSFALFHEQPITFPPTFKRTRSTAPPMYETKRLPAWCDRVLFHGMPGTVEGRGYWSREDVGSSDHKPVAARFRIRVPTGWIAGLIGAAEARRRAGAVGAPTPKAGDVGGPAHGVVVGTAVAVGDGVKAVGEGIVKAGDGVAKAVGLPGNMSDGVAAVSGFVGAMGSAAGSLVGLGGKNSSPTPPPVPGRPERWAIRIVSMRGGNIAPKDIGGTSDPYVIFTGENLVSAAKSGKIMRTLNPVWPASDLPTLRLRQTTASHPTPAALLRDLARGWLTVQVMDWDRGTQDDLCGAAQVPLAGLPEQGRWEWKARLRLVGVEQGWVSGEAEFVRVPLE